MVVCGGGDGNPQKVLVFVHRPDDGVRKSRNCAFKGRSPLLEQVHAVSVASDQLLCLPLPLTPAKGFSCSRQTKPCLDATFFMAPS